MDDALKKLYQDLIVDHHKRPRNQGPLLGATHEGEAVNPLCGDEVTVRLRVEGDAIAEVRFEARGCMLSGAAASMMTEVCAGKSVAAATAAGKAFADALARPGAELGPTPLEALSGVREFPSRMSCVTLPWQALAAAVAAGVKPASSRRG